MFRSILLPTLVAGVFAIPLLYQNTATPLLTPESRNANYDYDFYVAKPQLDYSGTAAIPVSNPLQTATVHSDPSGSSTAIPSLNASTMRSPTASNGPLSLPGPAVASPALAIPPTSGSGTSFFPASSNQRVVASRVDFSQLTPDYGAVETRTFRGNAYGPDLTSAPMQFIPVANFEEIFRFDVSPVWVKQRWERLTAIPPQGGLHGLRTALVTGTNSWDLNGSLTYFFDQNHRIQRIAFRGWVGDPARLIKMATQSFGLKPRPTHWAGIYMAEFGGSQTGALLMKDPDTIDRRNPVQRTAVIMEINQPAGGFSLSQEVLGFLQPALPGN